MRRRRRTVAVILSLLVHLVAALIFVHLYHRPESPRETVATTQRLTFDRKIVPKPRPPVPALRSKPIPLPPLPVPLPLARVRPPPSAKIVAHTHVAHVRAPRKELSKLAPRAPAAVPLASSTLSDARIAQITNDLRAEIASDVARRPSAVAVVPAPIEPPRHYALDASNFLSGDRSHHGLCDPIKDWVQDDYNYYYVACNVRFSDGTFQRQSVPWPVRYPPSNDPFAGTAGGEKPLAMPLPGWHLPAGETVTPELREYARDHGVTIAGG